MFTPYNIVDSIATNSNLVETPLNNNNESLDLTENLLEDVLSSKSSKNTKINLDQFDENDDFDDNEIYLCLFYHSNKLACTYYDLNKKTLFYMSEIQETLKFELTNLLIDDLDPQCVITSPRCDNRFVNFLKQKCKYTLSNDNNRSEFSSGINPEHPLFDQDNDDIILKLRDKKIQFAMIPSIEFNFDSCKERIFNMSTLESMPKNMNQSEKILYFSSLIDFDSKLTIQSCGALLKYLRNNRINFELERDTFETPIFYIKRLELKNLLLIDENSFKSLKIFNDVDYVFAYKQANLDTFTFRTHLNDKFNNTLYSLFLSKINTKFGIGKLRSFMMKPTRDMRIIKKRHDVISFLLDLRNQDLVQMIVKNLKKCKYINPILKRMRITRCGLNEWKRLYRTTQAFLELCNVKQILNQRLNLEPYNTEYEMRFDFLITLFERTIDLNESKESNEIKINSGISPDLDQKRQLYSELPEFLTHMAEQEILAHNLNGCKMTYLQLIGFLLILSVEDMNFDYSLMDPNEKLAEFEQRNQLKFIFRSNDKMYYKSSLCNQLDEKIGDLATDVYDLESQILDGLQTNFVKYSHLYANMIDFCAELDCLMSFAAIAREYNYTRPIIELDKGSFINAKKVRHPLVELNFDSISSFVPNDIESGDTKSKIKVITSPNASGKTVYLKQVGLLVYLTFIGSYVPGINVHIGDFDKIFTRIKSNECISLQMSSYAIDLKQVADSINDSTSKSLILIDEFGNGTSIFDGQAIVAAILRYWSNLDCLKCPHVFLSTHFYEMLQNSDILFGSNKSKIEFLMFDYMFESDEPGNNGEKPIVFLYKIKNGFTNSSYALNSIKKAKLKDEFIKDLQEIYDKILELKNTSGEEAKAKADDLKMLLCSDIARNDFEKQKNLVKEVFEMFYNFRNSDSVETKDAKGQKIRELLFKKS